MKKPIILFVFIVLTIFSVAQSNDSIPLIRKNVIKFLPVNLPFQSISFEYERMFSSKNSFTVGLGLPNNKSVIGKYGITDDNISGLKNAEYSTMHIRAAYRHYTGKHALPQGFYLEPYLKYQKISGTINTQSTDPIAPFNEVFDLNYNTMNLGIQLGTQFLISKRVSIDFYFLGLEAGLLNGELSAMHDNVDNASQFKSNVDNLFDGDTDDILYVGKYLSSIGEKVEVTQSADNKTVNVKTTSGIAYPWIRGGFSIGIAF